jgi:hypothetical protein
MSDALIDWGGFSEFCVGLSSAMKPPVAQVRREYG